MTRQPASHKINHDQKSKKRCQGFCRLIHGLRLFLFNFSYYEVGHKHDAAHGHQNGGGDIHYFNRHIPQKILASMIIYGLGIGTIGLWTGYVNLICYVGGLFYGALFVYLDIYKSRQYLSNIQD